MSKEATESVSITMPITILAIDPGTLESAYVVWDGERIHEHGKVANEQMLAIVYAPPCEVDLVVIERIASYGMRVGQEVFDTCLWTGRFVEAAAMRQVEVRLIYRMAVKMHLVGSPTANDADIRRRLMDIVGPPGTKKAPGPTYGIKSDVWQALALAVTARGKRDTADRVATERAGPSPPFR